MDDFEGLQEGETVLQHLIAGAVAGTAEHCVMFPVDTIKTMMQGAVGTNLGVIATTKIALQQHGFSGMWRGVSAILAGAAPAHSMHFATYEFCKEKFGGNKEGHHPLETAFSGVCATMVSEAIFTPMDAIKQRLQLRVKNYNGLAHCIQTVLRTEGVRAFYAGYTTTLLMSMPYHGIYFAGYESLRKILKRGSETEFDIMAHFLSGAGAGSLAAVLTNPFDVAKTRLQTQGDMGRHYSGLVKTLVQMKREEGYQVFLKGMKPRVILHSTSAAICWVTYEYAKLLLHRVGI